MWQNVSISSNKTPNLMQHCAGFISAESLYMFRASKTGTAAPGTGVIVAGRSSHHHIRDFAPFCHIQYVTSNI